MVVQWWSGRFEVENNLLFLLGIEQRFLRRPAINLCRLSHLDSLRKISGSENNFWRARRGEQVLRLLESIRYW